MNGKKTETIDFADRLSHAVAQRGEFQQLTGMADAKGGAAVAFATGLLTVLVGNYKPALELLSKQAWLGILILTPGIAFFIAFMMVLYYSFLTILPRLEKKEYKPSIDFFIDVFKMGEDAYIKAASAMPLEELLQHTLREIYMLSEILVEKFDAQRRCFQWLRVTLILWAITEVGVLLAQ
jgi:hypothetical protein